MNVGYTPLPDPLKDRLFRLAKKHDKKAALELWLLASTCRRSGWDGLGVGQVRVTETQAAEVLGVSRGYAYKLLEEISQECGLTRLGPGLMAWQNVPQESILESKMESPKTQHKPKKTKHLTETVNNEKESKKESGLESASYTRDTRINNNPPPKNNMEQLFYALGGYLPDGASPSRFYWATMNLWPKGYNPRPSLTLSALVEALSSGADPAKLYRSAEAYTGSVEDKKFLARPLSWLQNCGWATPEDE